jgi:metal-dependent amidase/aminoacylase/carboxypeptidase family protein
VPVLSEVHSLWLEAVALRRWSHLHPELSFKEIATVGKIADILRSYGISECTSVQRLVWLLSFVAEEAQDLA